MEVLKRAEMPNGTKIQIENWKNDYDFIKTINIAVYPIAQRGSEANKTFRLELEDFESDKEVQDIFEKLEKGKIELTELTNYFRSGSKDEYLLGIDSNKKFEGGNLKMEKIYGSGYKYEQILIMPGRYDEGKIKEVINSILEDWDKQELYIDKVKYHGKKQLAYDIRKEKEWYYLETHFISKPEIISELERKIRINDDIIKFITIKTDERMQGFNKIIEENDKKDKDELYYYNKYLGENKEKKVEDVEDEEEEEL